MNNSPIGIYDSGFGGLSVWRELRRELPDESLLYLGDGKNCPYGSLPEERIREVADEAVATLLAQGCKMVVVACNTATSAAIEFLRDKYHNVPIVGLEPAVKPACERSRTGVVGVVATERSLESEKFLNTLARYNNGVRVIRQVGRGFVEAVEANEESLPTTRELVHSVIEPIIEQGADIIVLGCTHYPFLREVINDVVGEREVEIIDSGEAVAKRVEYLLDELNLRAENGASAEYRFMTFADEEYKERLRRKAFGEI
ncbi:MAG: glutamate racemase [Alistipes sp.]|nr:glutamate racemase [Alistipes sp.]